jgi:spermidine/putrescine transport system permease protein
MALRLRGLLRAQGYALLSAPAVIWLVLFFVAPVFIVLGISFMSRGTGGLPVPPLTLDNYTRTFNVFGGVIWQSVRFALLTTVVCLLLGYPMAYFIKTRRTRWAKGVALFLVILPFWTNFLIRTYAWRFLLAREGLINNLLLTLGIVDAPLQILNTEFAVILGSCTACCLSWCCRSTPRWSGSTSATLKPRRIWARARGRRFGGCCCR